MPKDVSGANFLLGRGKVYFNRKSGALFVGELFMGNTPEFRLTPSQEVIEARSAADPASAIVASDVVSQDFEVEALANEFTPENLGLALFGTVNTAFSQGATPVVDQSLGAVLKGYYYPVGLPAGAREITAVTLKHTSGTPTYTLATDYEIDALEGRIYIVETGAIADGTVVKVSYTPTAIASRSQILAGESTTIEGALRFVSNNKRGVNRTWEFWNVSIRSDAALALIGNEYGAATLKGRVLADAVGHPTNQYFRVLKSAA